MKTYLLLTAFIAIYSFGSCQKENKTSDSENYSLGDTIEVKYQTTIYNSLNNLSVLFDSVKYDSRCPMNANCIWAGNAQIRLVVKHALNEGVLLLNTNGSPKDSALDGFRVELISLSPYPYAGDTIKATDYVAKIRVVKI